MKNIVKVGIISGIICLAIIGANFLSQHQTANGNSQSTKQVYVGDTIINYRTTGIRTTGIGYAYGGYDLQKRELILIVNRWISSGGGSANAWISVDIGGRFTIGGRTFTVENIYKDSIELSGQFDQ